MCMQLLKRPCFPAAVAGALIVSTAVAVLASYRLQQLTAGIVEENVASLRAAEEMELAIRDIRRGLSEFVHSQSAGGLADFPQLDAGFLGWLERGHSLATTAAEQDIIARLELDYGRCHQAILDLAADPAAPGALEAARRLAEVCTTDILPHCHRYLEINEASIEENLQRHRVLSGWLRWILVLAGLVVPLCGISLGYVVSRHISRELDQSRERLRRSDQMAAVGRLAAGMAHELRNPLTSILMMVQMSSLDDPSDRKVIEEEVRRMERTIQSCLDFARPRPPQRQAADLRDVIRYVCRLLEGRVRRQHLELTVDLGDEPLPVFADPHQLHQVFVNLLMNAIESAGPGGRVGIIGEGSGSQVLVTVWDEGSGIPCELLPRIFDPFVSGKESGTGLGLSICRQIVESHKGRIVASNRPVIGAQFEVQLPRQEGPSDAAAVSHRRRTEHSAVLPACVPG